MRLLRERIFAFPLALAQRLLDLHSVVQHYYPKCACRVVLLESVFDPKRLQKQFTKPHICQPWMFQIDSQAQVIKLWAFAARLARNPRREQADVESHCPQQGCESS